MAELGARLDEHEVVLARLLLALCRRHFAPVVEVGLVADEDDDDVVASLAADIVHPLARVLK